VKTREDLWWNLLLVGGRIQLKLQGTKPPNQGYLGDTEQAALNAKKQTSLQIAETGGRHSGFLHQRLLVPLGRTK
jgi:hypothetical protein